MADSIKIQPPEFDDEDLKKLTSGTAQDAPPPLTAQPVAPAPGLNLAALGSSLDSTKTPGQDASQAPTPTAPAPLPSAPPMANLGTAIDPTPLKMDSGAEKPKDAEAPSDASKGAYDPKTTQAYRDEFRRTFTEYYKIANPGPLAPPEQQSAAFTNAYAAAEKEMAPDLARAYNTNQYNQQNIDIKRADESRKALGTAADVNLKSSRKNMYDVNANLAPEKVYAAMRNSDAAVAVADVQRITALAQQRGINQNIINQTVDAYGKLHDLAKGDNAGPLTNALQVLPKPMLDLIGSAMSASGVPDDQIPKPRPETAAGRAAFQGALGAVNTPPPAPPPAAPPMGPSGQSLADILRMAHPGGPPSPGGPPAPTGGQPAMPPISVNSPLFGPPAQRAASAIDPTGGLNPRAGQNVGTFRPGPDDSISNVPPSGMGANGQVNQQGKRGLNDQANEQVGMRRAERLGYKDQAEQRRAFQDAQRIINLPSYHESPDLQKQWDAANYILYGKRPAKAVTTNG